MHIVIVLLSLLPERWCELCSLHKVDNVGEWLVERVEEGGTLHIIALTTLQLNTNS